MNIRLLMIAFLAIVCNTSKAQVPDSPLNPWYDSSANSDGGGYVLRTIDDEHTVLDAMKALQEINGTDWSDYSSYPFYLIEDVDLSQLDWVPLGTTDYPFYGNFYCYKPTYSWFSGPGIQASIEYPYPKVEDIENKPELQWEGAYKYTFSVSDIESLFGKTKYTFNVGDIESYISEHSEELSYSDLDGFISTELESNSILYKRTDDETLIVVTDNLSSINILSEVSYTNENYIENLDNYNNDFNTYISSILGSYFVEYDESAETLSFSATEDDFSGLVIFSCLTPTTDPEQAYYKLLPFTSNLGSLGYYYDESGNQIYYYSTDGHIGTCKIKNMTVDEEYDGAGFFGVVESGTNVNLYGFTFESCSVRNTKEDGYAGILYGVCNNESECPSIYDIFIGKSESNLCSVEADFVGGIYGKNVYETNQIYSTNSISSSEKTFDPELSPYDPETHEGAYYADDYEGSDGEAGYSVNKIYVNITARKNGNKISSIDSEAKFTYVYAAGISEKYAFGTKNGEYGEGTQSKPFIISDKDHLLHLQSILNGINGDSYKSYEDLKNLNLSTSYAGSIFDGCYFKQIEDIDFGDEPITAGIGIDDSEDLDTEAGPFAGTYDGGGHTIKVNIHIDEENTSDPAALFANTYEATIMNLSIKGTNTNDYQDGYAAGIVGNELYDYLTLQNCLIDVTIEAENAYALIGDLESTSSLTIQDCFNKGAKDLEWFSGANSYFTEDTNKDNTYFTWPRTYGGPGAGVPDSPLQISSLAVFNTEKGKEWAEYGLAYELTDNIVLQNTKLVDPDGDYIGPNDASNENYYIEKFCGTLIGGHYDETSSTYQTHIISGITDKALFGTITGDSKIEKIGFVNCYNANGDHSVKLAGNIESEKTLTVQECYSDGYMDLGYDTENEQSKDGYEVIDCYSYSDIANTPVKTFQKKNDAGWVADGVNPDREILSNNCIETNCDNTPIYSYKVNIFKKEYGSVSYDETDLYSLGSYYSTDGSTYFSDITKTDAISTIPQNNMVWNTDDPRLQFKYSVNYNGEVKYMYLTDIAAVGTSTDMSDAVINSMNFDTSYSYNIKNIYYRRPHHNAWESVTLPFAYNLNSINENFTALDYSENTSTTATFSSINKNTTIEAGRPVLFYNADSENTDFTAKASMPISIVTAGTGGDKFYGVLQTTGIRGAAIKFDYDCYEEYTGDDDKTHHSMYVYKISGANTGTAEEPRGKITLCSEASWIYPFRTYLKFLPGTLAAKTITFSIFEDSTTSIDDSVLAPATQITGEVYSLDGRKISTKGLNGLKAGLYIINGKKVIVK